MSVSPAIEYLRRNSGLLKNAFFLLLGALVLLDIFLPREDAHTFVDSMYAFLMLFTLVGCFVLIKVSKAIAHLFLGKDEDYYG